MTDRENCNKYFGLNTPTGLTEDQCIKLDNIHDVKFTKPGFFSKATAKTKNGNPFDLNAFKQSYEAEQVQAKKFRSETDAKEQAMKMAQAQMVTQVPVQTMQTMQPMQPMQTVKMPLDKTKLNYYYEPKARGWIECQPGQKCEKYDHLMAGEKDSYGDYIKSTVRKCNFEKHTDGTLYDGRDIAHPVQLDNKCALSEAKTKINYMKSKGYGGKRTKTKRRKPKRKTRR